MKPAAIVASAETLQGALETWFIQHELLQGIPCYFPFERNKLFNQVVIYLELHTIDQAIIADLKAHNCAVLLFHMGDEQGTSDKSLYDASDFIVRNYFHRNIFENPLWRDKILWVPNGYKTGVGPRHGTTARKATDRHFLASFIGWLNNPQSYQNERASFATAAQQCSEKVFLQATDRFNAGFNPGLYATFMESSVFSPCPAGNAAETIRLYDALETGAIPVMLHHQFLADKRTFSNPPFPLLHTWNELPDFLGHAHATLLTEPAAILELQQTCQRWWASQKANYAQQLERLIDHLSPI